jgi:hypothetical protein
MHGRAAIQEQKLHVGGRQAVEVVEVEDVEQEAHFVGARGLREEDQSAEELQAVDEKVVVVVQQGEDGLQVGVVGRGVLRGPEDLAELGVVD